MKIYPVSDPAFCPYGRIVSGLDTAKAEILQTLAGTPLPDGTDYVAEDACLQELPAAVEVSEHLFGGMPCCGRATNGCWRIPTAPRPKPEPMWGLRARTLSSER